MKEHAQKQWLTGISILDAEGNLVSEYAEDGVGYAQFQSEIEKEMLLSVIDAPKKTYVKHIEMADGSFMDIAARRCAEGAGAGSRLSAYGSGVCPEVDSVGSGSAGWLRLEPDGNTFDGQR